MPGILVQHMCIVVVLILVFRLVLGSGDRRINVLDFTSIVVYLYVNVELHVY